MVSEEKLKPCPFCGTVPVECEPPRDGYWLGFWRITCASCGLTMACTHRGMNVEAWNRRAERHAKRIIVANGATGHCNCEVCGGLIGIQDLYCKHCGAKLEVES